MPEVIEVVEGLRSILYDPQTPEKLGLQAAALDEVQGVVVEIGHRGTVIIVAGFKEGTSRLYFGRGGGVLGLKEDFPPETLQAARRLVAAAQSVLPHVPKEARREWPQEGSARFALLTPGGVHAVEEAIQTLETGAALLRPVWQAANQLLGVLGAHMRSKEEASQSAPRPGGQ
jgi:hypothetical protein